MGDVRSLVEKLAALLSRAQYDEPRLQDRAAKFLAEADAWLEEHPPALPIPTFKTRPCIHCERPIFWTAPEEEDDPRNLQKVAPTPRRGSGKPVNFTPVPAAPIRAIPTDPVPVTPEEWPWPDVETFAKRSDSNKVFGVHVVQLGVGFPKAFWRPLDQVPNHLIFVRHVCPTEPKPADPIRANRWQYGVIEREKIKERELVAVARDLEHFADDLEDL